MQKKTKSTKISLYKFSKDFWKFWDFRKISNFQIPDSEKKFGIIPWDDRAGPTKKGVARDPWGRVRRLELRGRGAMGFFLTGSPGFFVIFLNIHHIWLPWRVLKTSQRLGQPRHRSDCHRPPRSVRCAGRPFASWTHTRNPGRWTSTPGGFCATSLVNRRQLLRKV